jgi:hypothetical protein
VDFTNDPFVGGASFVAPVLHSFSFYFVLLREHLSNTMCRGLLLLCLLGAAGAVRVKKDDDESPSQSFAKLMKLGLGLGEQAKKSVDQHAFATGESVGKRLREDQAKFFYPSPEGRMNAAREGLKDSVQGGVSLLEQGVDEAKTVVETPDVMGAVENVRRAVAENPQAKALSDQSESMLQKMSDLVKGSADATIANLPEAVRTPLSSFQDAFAAGEKEEAEKLKASPAGDDKKVESVIQEHLGTLQAKANRFIQTAGKATLVGLDKAPEVALEASKAANAM